MIRVSLILPNTKCKVCRGGSYAPANHGHEICSLVGLLKNSDNAWTEENTIADELQSNLVTKILLKSQHNSSLLYNS